MKQKHPAAMAGRGAMKRTLLFTSILGLAPILSLPVQAAESEVQAVKDFNIRAGSLESALNQLGQQAGILLSYPPKLTADRQSTGLAGRYTLQQASVILLQGSGLSLKLADDGSYFLANRTSELAPVVVTGNHIKTGSVSDGYRVSKISDMGPLRDKALLDTPYSVSILPSTLFENINAGKPSDAQRISPFVQLSTSQDAVFTNSVDLRGFSGSGWNQKFENGLRASSLAMVPMEDKERMEVLTGVSGFLYGMANPGGVINYVLKQPTVEPLTNITAGSYGAQSYFAHADLSDKLDEAGKLSYRLNMVAENGDTAVDEQSRERYLISSIFNYNASEDLLLQLNASHSYNRMDGPTALWSFMGGEHPVAPDSSKQWGQSWAFGELDSTKVGAKAEWDLSDNISVRSAISHSFTERKHMLGGNGFVANDVYVPFVLAVAPQKHYNTAANLFADTKILVGETSHTLTAGVIADRYKTRVHKDDTTTQFLSGMQMYNNEPLSLAPVSFSNLPIGNDEVVDSARARNTSFILADSIEFNEQWSSIIGVARTNIRQTNYDYRNTGNILLDYNQSAISPNLSLTYKPQPWLATYATYMEGLEQGGTAPVGSANEGELLAPVDSKQYELGVKAELQDMLLTAAVFDVRRTNEFLDIDNVFKQQGYQHNLGLELSATGKLTDNLTVISGITLLDAEVDSTGGTAPVGVSEKLIKLYAEYDMRRFAEGLTLSGGAFYTGERAVNTSNTEFLPAYTLLDAGLRYEVKSLSTPLTLTLNVKNLTNKNYWSNVNYLGEPRTVTFAAKFQF